jgi:hypothetical protein
MFGVLMTHSQSRNKTQSEDSTIQIKDLITGSYRIRFFLFILLVYIAGATLDITNTNPGSRFMLTKEIAQEGDFAIREEVRERYSYLDFSVINQIANPSFEQGDGSEVLEWTINGTNTGRKVNNGYTGNYSLELNSTLDWAEQNLRDIAVENIYENYTFKIRAKRDFGSDIYLNITFTYSDNSKTTYWILIKTTSFVQYSMQFNSNDLDKSITNIRFQNANSSRILLDDCELYYSYSDKPIGVSLLAVPIYWIGEFIVVELIGYNSEDWTIIDSLVKLLIMIAVLIFGAFTVLRFYDFLRLEGISHSKANWTALLFGLGSLFYVYAGTFFSHSITASFLLFSLYYCSKFRKERTITSLLWAGIFSGYSVVCDYIFLFFLPFFVIYLFIPFPWNLTEIKTHWKNYFRFYLSSTIIYLIPVVICGLLVTYYNFICFGDPFVTPYSFARFFKDVQHFAAPMEEGLEILLTSSHHGLITFMPVILVSLIGIIPLYRKNPALAVMCLTTPMLLILLYSKYYLPTGGLAYGPRQLVPITPFLLIPLAFIIDTKEDGKQLKKFTDAFKSVFLLFGKGLAVIFGLITFIINFAGGWVGVYPRGGQDMSDPIWGSFDQSGEFIAGHLEALFSWINVAFDFNGKLTLELLQGHYAGGVKLNLIFIGVSLDIQWPAASTLALFEIGAFCVIIFLILLINPYYSIGKVKQFFVGKIKPFYSGENPEKLLKRYTLIESILLLIFVIWIVMDIFRLLGIPVQSFVTDALLTIIQVKLNVASIPGINFLADSVYFIIYFVVNFLFLRSDLLSLQAWFFTCLLFILVTSVTWVPYSQIQKLKEHRKTEKKGEFQADWIDSGEFRLFHWVSRILAGLYLLLSLVTIIFANPGNSVYAEFSVMLYIIVFGLIISTTIPVLLIDASSAIMDIPKVSESKKPEINSKWTEIFITRLILLFIIIIFVLEIIIQLIRENIPLSDFFIIRPSFNNLSIQEWFFQGRNAVPIYLSIFVLFLFIVAMAFFLPELSKKYGIRSMVPLLPSDVEKRIQNEGKSLAGFQSTMFFGGYVIVFLYLLITVLYSALSSVPNPSFLPTYPEESLFWNFMFLLFLCGLLFTGIRYTGGKTFSGIIKKKLNNR